MANVKKWWKVVKSGGLCQIFFYVCLLESEHTDHNGIFHQ
ncbi:hypothetical protein C900_02240 [Fulvivirga imtechensis AK7]|uniref:Uncharacterized protein n=1 Tax=Fulvivirga imtechensis AK7 TaxID=1237149 RepID=L8JSP0_9BACT|nr:hypothetical protein C900_02240 [Fulvivirga imtechensis AK7]